MVMRPHLNIKRWLQAHRIGRNLCQLYICQGISNQNIQGAQNLNSKKINDPIKKWANELEQSVFKGKSPNG
jgi:hypothetical protein